MYGYFYLIIIFPGGIVLLLPLGFLEHTGAPPQDPFPPGVSPLPPKLPVTATTKQYTTTLNGHNTFPTRV